MLSFHRPLAVNRSRRAAARLRLETLEARVTPVLGVGVNVTSLGSMAIPATGNGGAVGPNHYVQMQTGNFIVFDKAGNLLQQKSDDQFWQSAGISSTLTITGLSQPKVIYDALTDRWFAMEINMAATNNQVFLARSDTADPTGTWKAVFYTGMAGQFAGFPTLGLDKAGVYVGTANFFTRDNAIPLGVTLVSVPKADLLLGAPTLANMTVFNQGAPSAMGWAPQVVTNFAATPTAASVIATNYSAFSLINYTELTGAANQTPNGATLGSTITRAIPYNALPGKVWQADDSRVISGGDDDRYASATYQLGDLIFCVHAISVNSQGVGTDTGANTTDGIQLIIIRDSTNTVVATGTYFNPNYDYSYPSVAANQYGDIVIGVNRSGKSDTDGFLGAYAVYARIDPANPTSITFGQEIVLKAGIANYHQQGGILESWGPYSSIQVDPSNPFAFWTSQMFAQSTASWATGVSQVFVSPRVTGVSSTAADGQYGVGAVIPITITFNHPVVVTGNPQLALNTGGTAVYASGSGTNTLTFNYTVGAGQTASDLDYTSVTALSLNGGTIKDAIGGVDAELNLPTPGAAGSLGANKNISISSNVPGVTGVSSTTANGTYGFGTNIAVTITFNRAVVVTGNPQLALNSGGTATYSSGSGTTTLTFTYTVGAGHNSADLDYTSTTALILNGGTIKDQANASDAVLTLPTPGASGSLGANKNIVIDALPPVVTGVTSPTANGSYGVGATISVTVTFNKAVAVTGTPQLALNSGGTATYTSGTGTTVLTFTYTVAAGQNTADLDYTSSSALTLNGGTISEVSSGQNATLTLPTPGAAGSLGANKNIVIDTAPPVVTGVSSTTPNGTYGAGANIAITITFNKAVAVTGSPQLALNSGGTATYSSGTGTTVLTFTYTVAAGQTSADLDYTSASALTLNGGTITEVAGGQNATLTLPAPGAAGSLGANKNIVIDAAAPVVTGVSSPTPNGTYSVGANIAITVTFDKAVAVTGTPQLALNSGGTATYSSGTGTTTLTFTYTVATGQSSADLDYSSANALMLNGGTIKEVTSGQNANLTLPAPGSAGSLAANKNIVINTVQANVTNVTSPTANGAYAFGAIIDVTVQFSQTVNVTGSPHLALNTGGTAVYLSGSGTNTLTFRYQVGSGDLTGDLDYASVGALTLNGGTIKDTNGVDAILALPTPGGAGSLAANKAIVVDAVGPTVLQYRVLFGSKWYNVIGSTRFDLPWLVKGVQVVFSEPVYSAKMASLTGLPVTSLTGLRTRTLTWRFGNIAKGSFNTSLASTGTNAIKDIAGNPISAFNLSFNVLYGDFDGNGFVDAADEAGVRANITSPYQVKPSNYNIFADLSGDGIVNLTDVGIAKTRKGQSLS